MREEAQASYSLEKGCDGHKFEVYCVRHCGHSEQPLWVIARCCIPSPLGVYHRVSVQSKLIRNSWPLHLLSPYSLLLICQNSEPNTSLQDTGVIIPWSLCCVTWASNTLKASGTCCDPSNRSSSTFQFMFMIYHIVVDGCCWFRSLI